MTIRNVKSHE